jgi:hypothetical protein
MSTQYAFGRIVTSGLVLALDAADRNSYMSGSTVWNDVSGNGNSGSLVNGPTFSNNSIVFDGVDDYAVRTDAALKNYTTITANIWMYLTSYISSYETYISYNAEEGTLVQGWGVRRSLGATFQYWGGTGNTGIKLYKNGVLAGSSVSTWATVSNINTTGSWEMITLVATGVSSWNTHNRFTIANRSDSINTATNMQAGSFILYNRELTIQEILQNYNAQKSRFNL